MIRRKTLVIALFALNGLAAAPCAAEDIEEFQSGNWSGYVILSTPVGQLPPSTTFTTVRARWRQPTVICTTPNAQTAIWVGFDGFPARPGNEGTVEQLGTLATCGSDPNETAPVSYTAWWEMKADGVTDPPHGTEFDVSPGDLIDAAVTYSDGAFVLQLIDRTTQRSFMTRRQTCDPAHTCPRSSAEFIVERPGETSFPLGNYGSMVFTEMEVSGNPANRNFRWARVIMRVRDSETIMSSCVAPSGDFGETPFTFRPPVEIGCKWHAATP
jgi:hypothetical protein